MAQKNHERIPSWRREPQTSKTPRVAQDPDSFHQKRPSWRVSMIEMRDPCGWHTVDAKTTHYIREKLSSFESMTWAEILIKAKKQNHIIPITDFIKEARDHLVEIKQDDVDEIVSLRLSATERVYGILENAVLKLLWWDPNHKLCPSELKHT